MGIAGRRLPGAGTMGKVGIRPAAAALTAFLRASAVRSPQALVFRARGEGPARFFLARDSFIRLIDIHSSVGIIVSTSSRGLLVLPRSISSVCLVPRRSPASGPTIAHVTVGYQPPPPPNNNEVGIF